ncbi:hypothetical protein B9Z55_011880 [Caenorhabditis nigoni]|uniref:Uncharacterized protein n=1 Tax=Caenorhabditis nigoni TaxID=1611254 RepID=A0A2G5ULZ4_9PELO|nr:hypothetical protein B9Z55_011880 [Caenorhabditis nigoni]
MLDSPLESIITCSQFTGFGVFYTYFLSCSLSFNLSLTKALYIAFLGATLVYSTGYYQFDNLNFEPKSVVVYGLFIQSFCSAALTACFFANKNYEDAMILQVLPKLSILLFYTAFYLNRVASIFYVRIISRAQQLTDGVTLLSWVVTVILLGFNIVGYEGYKKSLGITMVAYGFLYLSLGLYIKDKVPEARGLMDHEISKLFGFGNLETVLKYEEHRTFSCNEGSIFYFRNLTNEKIAIDISFSNPEDHVKNFNRRFIRGRGHVKFDIKRGPSKMGNDRFFVFYAKKLKDLDDYNNCGFITVQL